MCNSLKYLIYFNSLIPSDAIIGSDYGLSPVWRQAIIRTSSGILFIWPIGTNLNEPLSEIHTFSFKKMYLKMLSGKWWPFCLGLNVLIFMGFIKLHHSNEMSSCWQIFHHWLDSDCTESHHFDEFQFSQWRKFRHFHFNDICNFVFDYLRLNK